MTKVISSRLSDAEHLATVEMSSLIGESVSEFIHNCILNELCSSRKRKEIDATTKEKFTQMKEENDRRFLNYSNSLETLLARLIRNSSSEE